MRSTSRTFVLLSCVFAVMVSGASPASARLAVVTTGKTKAAIVDLDRKKVTARPETGLPTRGVALTLDGLRAYVVSSTGSAGRLSVLDLQTRAIVGQLGVPAGARGVALSADGTRAYVTSGNRAGRLSIVNLTTGALVGEITTPRRPAAVALSPDGARAYVLCARKLAVIDLLALRRVKSLRVGRRPFDVKVHPGGGALYVTNAAGRSVSVDRHAAAARRAHRAAAPSGRGHRTVVERRPRRGGPGPALAQGDRAEHARAFPGTAHLGRQGTVLRRLLPHRRAHLCGELGLGHGDVRERVHLPPPSRARAGRAAHQRDGRAVRLFADHRHSRP